MVRSPSPSVIATPRIMALTAGAFYGAGGVVALAVVLGSPSASPGPRHALLALAVVALLTGAGLLARGKHLPRGAFHAVVGAGTLLTTLAVPLCPTTPAALAVAAVYAFIAVDVVFFFRRGPGAAHLAALLLGATWTLHDRPGVTAAVGLALGTVLLVLTAAVGVLVRIASDAHHDSLTGLRNRRGFDVALDAALLRARTGTPLAAVLLDVDHFGTVNDAQGHDGGDRLLQALAHDLTRGLPAGAVLARYGGDEFAVLLPGTTGGQALDVLSRLRESVTVAGFSAGVAGHLPGESGADLLRRADTALHAAKTAGRGRCRLDDLDSAEMARDLAAALAAGDVRAWFQPIVEPATGRVVGVEALARWTHPTRGPVRPDEFIAVAETTGLVVELGAAVLADACRGARALTAVHGDDLLLTVNVSGRELVCPDYADRALDLVAAAGWPVTQLVVEVTESLLDGSSGPALRSLERLRAAGAAVAIDDFGTGYSAFSRLDTLPADYLKLDHGFTAQITTSQRRAALLTALLSLSGTLGLRVIAEGVETPEQADLLARAGCPLTQGYLFSRPAPAAELLRRAGSPEQPARPALPALRAR